MAKQSTKKITVIIADDHPLFRKGLEDVVREDSRIEIVDTTGNGDRALELIEQKKPDIAILDIDMPGISGLEISALVVKKKLPTNVIILTMHDDQEHFDRAMHAGVAGYIVKDSAAGDILSAIDVIQTGKTYISPILSYHLLKKDSNAQLGIDTKLGIDILTPTERKIVSLIAQSKSSKEIAAELFISPKTVAAHRANICVKLRLKGTNALLKFALENKTLL
ncbi:MAG: response regulator transcription factor [Bacteroidota bacterium]